MIVQLGNYSANNASLSGQGCWVLSQVLLLSVPNLREELLGKDKDEGLISFQPFAASSGNLMTVVALVVFEAICVVKSYIFLQAHIFIICILQVHSVFRQPPDLLDLGSSGLLPRFFLCACHCCCRSRL